MNSLVEVCRSQERYDEAESLLKRVLHTRENLFGSEHQLTLHTKCSLADASFSQRNHDAAAAFAALLQQVLHALERDLGLQHSDTLAMYLLAHVYTSQDRNAEAEKLLAHVVAGEDKLYGLSHRDTCRLTRNLGEWMRPGC
jgi:hypothetical protein